MRVPLSWLREFVPVEAEADELADRLSLSGFAVEEIVRLGRGISGVVVGEVRSVRAHPNADNLTLVVAFDGERERDIVCGARNFGAGDRVAIALPGARLPNGMEIAQRQVRGEVSDGMLCSASELAISDDHSGILVLDADAPLGADLVRALELDDVVYDLDVTTNRGDALSILGIAREVAALYGLPLSVPDAKLREDDDDAAALARVTIEDPRGCPRYLARVITGVTVQPSPWWMRRRILAAGMRPISNVVDVTNYVLLERGHPLHAFDLDRLTEQHVVVRRPLRGERLVTLDGVDRALERDDVVICDAERPVAIAGVMGGEGSEVGESTTRLLLEAAYFDPQRIRRTAARSKMRTEASVRFERGADPEAVPSAAARACELLADVAGGTVAVGAIDVYPRRWKPKAIRLRPARANTLLGTRMEPARMSEILERLGCTVTSSTRAAVRVEPPSWRPDLSIEEDLIEEVARIHGYEQIPETLPAGARTGGLTVEQQRLRVLRRTLLATGVSEAQTLSLLPPGIPDRMGLTDPHHPLRVAYRIANPLSEEESVLRSSLMPGLLLAARRNVARRVLPVRLFEIGTVFVPGDGGIPVEVRRVAWVLSGPAPDPVHAGERALDFFDGKGILVAVLDALAIGDWTVERGETRGAMHPGRFAAVLLGDREIGTLGELHPRVADAFELPGRVVVGQLDLDPLLAAPSTAAVVLPPRFPAVRRDLAIVVPADTPAAEVASVIRDAGGTRLGSAELFDLYRGAPVPEGKVSLAFALEVRDPDRTLSDAEADATIAAILEAIGARGWAIRD